LDSSKPLTGGWYRVKNNPHRDFLKEIPNFFLFCAFSEKNNFSSCNYQKSYKKMKAITLPHNREIFRIEPKLLTGVKLALETACP
jgi:hypothetical protein